MKRTAATTRVSPRPWAAILVALWYWQCFRWGVVVHASSAEEAVCNTGEDMDESATTSCQEGAPTATDRKVDNEEEIEYKLDFVSTDQDHVDDDAASTSVFNSSSLCTLYLAESSIPNAGLGVYSGVKVKKGQEVGFGDAVITVTDLMWHNDKDSWEEVHFLWSEYVWTADNIAADNAEEVHAIVAGFGAAVNAHPGIPNIEGTLCKHDSLGLDRRRDAGAGAYSALYDRKVLSTVPIPAGGEIFLDYGKDYFDTRVNVYGLIPRKRDYVAADRFLRQFKTFLDRHGEIFTGRVLQDLWHVVLHLPYLSKPYVALPRTLETALQAMKYGVRQEEFSKSIRSLEWLQQHGKCMDNIRPGVSTIRQAGRGAFATRWIPKGGLVSPSPLVHIPDRNILRMYNYTVNQRGKHVVQRDAFWGFQLLLNYCFGHASSTLLLCPYGHTTLLINHSWQHANAQIVWATEGKTHRADWLDKSVLELEEEWHAGLAFDYIATRDIQPGEEVFLNYGKEWEEAWQAHVQNFQEQQRQRQDEEYVSAWQLNHYDDDENPGSSINTAVLRTQEEQEEDPYPSNVKLRCFFTDDDLKPLEDGVFLVYDWHDIEEDRYLYDCQVSNRTAVGDGSYTYEVTIPMPNEDDDDDDEDTEEGYIVEGVPREEIVFYDCPYTEDQFQPFAFRHEMMIPNEMFPAAWRNLEDVDAESVPP